MILMENKIAPFGKTKASQRKKKFNDGAMKAINNTIADKKMRIQEIEEEKEEKMKDLAKNFKLANGKKKRDKIKAKAEYKRNKKEKLFKESVYDVFYQSLPLDEEFKNGYKNKLKSLSEGVLSLYLEENKITLKDLSKRSELLEALINLCEETASAATEKEFSKDEKEILNEKDSDEDELEAYDDVEVDEDEILDDEDDELQEAHDAEKENVTHSLAEEIKQTVIDTIQQEADAAKELQAERQDIKDTIQATTDDIDHTYEEETDEEEENPVDDELGTPNATTAGKMTGNKLDVDNSTDSDETEEEYTDTTKVQNGPATDVKKKIVESARIVTMRRKAKNTDSLYKNIMTSVTNKAIREQYLSESGGIDVNMDLVMAESLMYYTLLETMHQMKILDCKKSELKKFSEALLHMSK